MKIIGTFVIAVGTIWFAMLAISGDDKAPNQSDDAKVESEQAAMIQRLALADELARFGDETSSAIALISAAEIKKSIPTQESDVAKTNDDAAKKEEKKSSGVSYSVESLLLRAGDLAGERKDLLGLIDDVSAMGSRGDRTGPNEHYDSVRARATDTYRLVMRGSERATVYVSGDGDTDLDLYIYDEYGNQICSDTDSTDEMRCDWTPRWTGTFRIEIKNLGGVYNQYVLLTN